MDSAALINVGISRGLLLKTLSSSLAGWAGRDQCMTLFPFAAYTGTRLVQIIPRSVNRAPLAVVARVLHGMSYTSVCSLGYTTPCKSSILCIASRLT